MAYRVEHSVHGAPDCRIRSRLVDLRPAPTSDSSSRGRNSRGGGFRPGERGCRGERSGESSAIRRRRAGARRRSALALPRASRCNSSTARSVKSWSWSVNCNNSRARRRPAAPGADDGVRPTRIRGIRASPEIGRTPYRPGPRWPRTRPAVPLVDERPDLVPDERRAAIGVIDHNSQRRAVDFVIVQYRLQRPRGPEAVRQGRAQGMTDQLQEVDAVIGP